jgi:hypothetical protein
LAAVFGFGLEGAALTVFAMVEPHTFPNVVDGIRPEPS